MTKNTYPGQDYTYPDTLSFTHETTTQLHNLQRVIVSDEDHSVVPLWACSEDGDKFRGATYTAEEIAEHFAKGRCKEVSFAEEAQDSCIEQPPKERELVFPFVVEVKCTEEIYEVIQGDAADRVTMVSETYDDCYTDCFTKEQIKRWIKSGNYIVKSVGPQKASEQPTSASSILGSPTRPAPPTPAVKPYKGIEIEKHTVGHVSSLSIKVDSEQLVEATERAERLAEACERVNIALESFASIIKSLDMSVSV